MKLPAEIIIKVTEEDIELATRGNPGGCVYANAIGRTLPQISNVIVTDGKIAFSDRAARVRYNWYTPTEIAAYLQDWDKGKNPVPPVLVLVKRHALTDKMKERSIREKAAARANGAKLRQKLATETKAETQERQRKSRTRQKNIRRGGMV